MDDKNRNKEGVELFNNPKYNELLEDWKKYRDILEGKKSTMTQPKYLYLHEMENLAEGCDSRLQEIATRIRNNREERTEYINYIKMIVNRLVSLILKGGFDTDEVDEIMGEALNNIDGFNSTIDEYSRKLVEDILVYGICYNLTDKSDTKPNSIKEEKEMGLLPYFTRIAPLDHKDWEYQYKEENSMRGYELIASRYEFYNEEARGGDLTQQPKEVLYCRLNYLKDDKYNIQFYKSNITKETVRSLNVNTNLRKDTNLSEHWVLDKEISNLELPFIPIASSRQSESYIKDLIPIALKIYNKQSSYDNILYYQAYDRIFIMTDLKAPTGKDKDTEVYLGASSITKLAQDDKVIKLDPTNPIALSESISNDIQDFFRIAFLQKRTVNQNSRTGESADTLKEQKEDLFTYIKMIRQEFLDVLNTSVQHFAQFQNSIDFEGKLAWKEDIDEDDIDKFINYVTRLSDVIARYPTLTKAVHKKLVQSQSFAEESEILDEIENTSDDLLNEEKEESRLMEIESAINSNKKATSESKSRSGVQKSGTVSK